MNVVGGGAWANSKRYGKMKKRVQKRGSPNPVNSKAFSKIGVWSDAGRQKIRKRSTMSVLNPMKSRKRGGG